MPDILTVCLNPVIQKTILLTNLVENEVNRSKEYRTDASGKGVNVTSVLQQLGEHVVHLTQAGGQFRDFFLNLCNQDKLDIKWVESNSEIRSCYTLLNSTSKTSTEIVEEAQPVDEKTEERVWQAFEKLVQNVSILVISGSKAAGFSEHIFPNMVKMAKELDKVVILDYRGKDLINSLPFKPDFIKPNRNEFINTFFQGQQPSQHQIEEKLIQLGADGISSIITNGEKDILFLENGKVRHIKPEIIEPINTIGCGDAFTVGLASALLHGEKMRDSIQKGLDCAKLNALNIRPGAIK